MNNHLPKLAVIIAFLAANLVLFQNCDKKMQFSTSSSTLGGYNPGEGDGDNDDNYNPGEGDGIPNPNDPNDPDNPPPNPGDPNDPNDPTNPPCTVTYNEIQTPVKVLFLIDKTGSNKDNTNTDATNDGTDVNKNWRRSIIDNLINGLDLNHFSFNLTLFRGNHTNVNDGHRYNSTPDGLTRVLINGFSNSRGVIDNAILEFIADDDKGKTPYEAALKKAQQIINSDYRSETGVPQAERTKYSVIMITDGHPDPNLATTPGGTYDNGAHADLPQSVAMARGFANDIVAGRSSRINVNTVYYYNPGQRSSNAIAILQGIADSGGGKFIEAVSNNYTLDFKNIIRVPANTCPN